MKKIFILICILISIFSVQSVSAATIDDLEYDISYYGELYIKSCDTSAVGELEIPHSIHNSPVKFIAVGAFKNCTGLTKIIIPDGVNAIEESAFQNCTSLTDISIPNSVTTLGAYAFQGCVSLESIEIPGSITEFGSYVFQDCTSIKSAIFAKGPEGKIKSIPYGLFLDCINLTDVVFSEQYLGNIGAYAFRGCTALEKISLPDVTGIDMYAFDNCTNLKEISWNFVGKISNGAFRNCTSLTGITLSDNSQVIEDGAFRGCTSLTKIDISEENQYFSSIDGNLYNKNGTKLVQYAVGKTDEIFEIPDTVTLIDDYAFSGSKNLVSVTIPASVTKIGDYSTFAFAYCTNLTNINVAEENQYFSSVDGNLYNKNQTELIQYASGKTDAIFEVPDTVTTLTNIYLFSGSENLKKIIIPDSVTNINVNSFKEDIYITDIEVSENNPNYSSIDGNLYNKDKTAILLYIPDEAVTSFGIPAGVTTVSYRSFSGCTTLKELILPAGVTQIGNYAFDGCIGLTSIAIPVSLKTLGDYAFSGCVNLSEINYSGSRYEWNKIPKNITNLTIADDITLTSLVKTPYNTETFISDSKIFTIKCKNMEHGNYVILAFYYNNQLVELHKEQYSGSDIVFTTNRSYTSYSGYDPNWYYDCAKVMSWKDLDELNPLYMAEKVK